MFLTIPKKYKNGIILVALLRNKLREWNITNLRKELRQGKVRDYEIEDDYYRIEKNFKSIEDFCTRPPFKFVVKRGGEINVFNDGPEIYFDADKNKVVFNPVDLYPVPQSIKKRFYKVCHIIR